MLPNRYPILLDVFNNLVEDEDISNYSTKWDIFIRFPSSFPEIQKPFQQEFQPYSPSQKNKFTGNQPRTFLKHPPLHS